MFCQIFVRHEVYRDCPVCLGYRVFKGLESPNCSFCDSGESSNTEDVLLYTILSTMEDDVTGWFPSVTELPLHPTIIIPVNLEGQPLSAPAPDTSYSRQLCITGILILAWEHILPLRVQAGVAAKLGSPERFTGCDHVDASFVAVLGCLFDLKSTVFR